MSIFRLNRFFFLSRVVAVVIFGAMGIGETIAFAPDYTKAKLAASKMFALLDRVPPIDVASDTGVKIVRWLNLIMKTNVTTI